MSNALIATFNKVFPIPRVLHLDFVGIDLSADTVRVMQLKDNKFGKVPWRYKEYFLKNRCGLFNPNPVLDANCAELETVLKTIKKDFGISYAAISVLETQTYIYKTELPKTAESNMQEAILFDLGEHVPLSPQEAIVDPFVLKRKRGTIDVVVSAIPANVIELYTSLFEKVGIKPVTFEPEMHAISRGIIQEGDNNPKKLIPKSPDAMVKIL